MIKKEKVINTIIVLTTFLVILGLPAYFWITGNIEAKQAEVEEFVQPKELAFKEYKESIKEILNSENKDDKMKVAEESAAILNKMKEGLNENYFDREKEKYDPITKDFDKRLGELKKEAKSNLNNSLDDLLKYSLESSDYEYYEKIRNFYYMEYANQKNKELEDKVAKQYKEDHTFTTTIYFDESGGSEKEEKESHTPALREGMSKSEVIAALGTPPTTYRNDEAEFWVYGNLVLIIADGYVVNVSYGN